MILYVYCTPHTSIYVRVCVYTAHIIRNIIQKPPLTNNVNSKFSGLRWDDGVVYNVLYKILALRVID